MRLSDLQRTVHAGLLGDPTPALAMVDGPHAAERFAVHRRHVATSLTGALRTRFPAIENLVGAEFFGYAADTFLRAHPPRSPCLIEYGAAFPDFLATFAPARDVAYLADVARLEWMLHDAARAPVVTPIAASALAAIPPAELATARFQLDPARHYATFAWPVDDILAFARDGGDTLAVEPAVIMLEVFRRGDQAGHRRLPPATYALRAALAGGSTLADAIVTAGEGCDVAEAFGGLLAEGAVIGHEPHQSES